MVVAPGGRRDEIVDHIVARLAADRVTIAADFGADKGIRTRSTAIDDLLPPELATEIFEAFPSGDQMRLLSSFRERKFTSKSFDRFDPLVSDATFAFQDERVVALVSEITGISDAVGDPHLYAGGISAMEEGHFLNPHIDNSHDHQQRNYRVLNLLYYVTPDWTHDDGGNLELWDGRVIEQTEIVSRFNRLVLMSTNDTSFHSVSGVTGARRRCCVSNYYFSPHSPNSGALSHVTYFRARPEQRVRRVLTRTDSELRTVLRKVRRSGFGKRDLFESSDEASPAPRAATDPEH